MLKVVGVGGSWKCSMLIDVVVRCELSDDSVWVDLRCLVLEVEGKEL